MTQEKMASLLGTRRTTVSHIASRLYRVDAISYRRGRVTIHNRDILQSLACDCHAALGRANWPAELLRKRQ
jgi:hypothetical protein